MKPNSLQRRLTSLNALPRFLFFVQPSAADLPEFQLSTPHKIPSQTSIGYLSVLCCRFDMGANSTLLIPLAWGFHLRDVFKVHLKCQFIRKSRINLNSHKPHNYYCIFSFCWIGNGQYGKDGLPHCRAVYISKYAILTFQTVIASLRVRRMLCEQFRSSGIHI